MENKKINKAGQVTIFIILGIVLAVLISLIVIMSGKDGETLSPEKLGPKAFVASCTRDVVEKSVDKMMENAGEISPTQYINYQGEAWNYLCYHPDYYQTCYNIHPGLEAQIEREIKADTESSIQNCFSIMENDFDEKGYEVSMGDMEYSVNLLPGSVEINVNRNVEISGESGAESFEDFGSKISSPIYDLVRVARLIVNDEAQYCNFEYNGYMLLYPEYDIRRISYQESRLYIVEDRKSGAKFKFAVRSCASRLGI